MERRTPTVSGAGPPRSYDRDPGELIRLAVSAQWHGDPPNYVSDWLGDR